MDSKDLSKARKLLDNALDKAKVTAKKTVAKAKPVVKKVVSKAKRATTAAVTELKRNGRKSIGDTTEADNIIHTVMSSPNLMTQFEYMCGREDAYKKLNAYDPEKALIMFTYLADAGAREAARKIHKVPATKYTEIFTAETRRMAGREFLGWYEKGEYFGKNIESAGKTKSPRKAVQAPISRNPAKTRTAKQVLQKYPAYKFYVVDNDTKILAGNDDKEDAIQSMRDLPPRLKAVARVITATGYSRITKSDPRATSSWSSDKDLIGSPLR